MPLHIKSDLLRPLAALEHVGKGALAYYTQLRHSPDPIIAVGAWCALFDGKHIMTIASLWEEALGMCRYAAVRRRAFDLFETDVMEHALAERAAHTPAPTLSDAVADLMRAELAFDSAAAIDACGRAYLATGDSNWLNEALGHGETLGGWAHSQPWMIRMIVIDPRNFDLHVRALNFFDGSGLAEALIEYAAILKSQQLFPYAARLFEADGAYFAGDAERCLRLVNAVAADSHAADPIFRPFRAPMLQIKARAEEKLGRFEDAYRDFSGMNSAESAVGIDPEDHYRRTQAKKQLRIPLLPPDARTDVVQMLGFPRSGTTLLENALAAHPAIETFEEIPAMKAALDSIELAMTGRAPPPASPVAMYERARRKYYEEIDVRRRKPEASVLIDKMPFRSSEADFLGKVFPDWRYIFSVRHPYDVVLSCFKQRFQPNTAMENFRTIEKTARAYDHAMTEWFTHHGLDDPHVQYVRYDDLVTDFERVMTEVLGFLGLEWEDAVRDFARAAGARASRTPSYQKVRQGLTIGVQSYWRNYGFVFESAATRPLRKWVELFGYEC